MQRSLIFAVTLAVMAFSGLSDGFAGAKPEASPVSRSRSPAPVQQVVRPVLPANILGSGQQTHMPAMRHGHNGHQPIIMLAPDQPSGPVQVGPVYVTALAVSQPVSPLSVNPVDPHTIVAKTASGSVVMTNPYHQAYSRGWRQRQQARPAGPYAPPAFHIIGEPPRKHMAKAVELTHGIKPGRRLKTQPKVTFLVQKPGEKRLSVR